ncbi:hypothetical protein [Streptomyces albireticuli]|uniref:hypothetical protein n=1 Tax=Streptomyces albireticuli TaxID=1940 RepID=UPI001180E570|nr:hypothetical protein [Streptomyces albireticuli]MCD9195096.1 hypothetical protein [Streptomyces albireticuli]
MSREAKLVGAGFVVALAAAYGKVDDAERLVRFGRSKGPGRLSMWSATRDKPRPGGARNPASATFSSIPPNEPAFTRAFGAYRS